jgi:hypothetical protein
MIQLCNEVALRLIENELAYLEGMGGAACVVEMERTAGNEFSARPGESQAAGVSKYPLGSPGVYSASSEPRAAEIIDVGGIKWAVPKPVAQISK